MKVFQNEAFNKQPNWDTQTLGNVCNCHESNFTMQMTLVFYVFNFPLSRYRIADIS